jgi:hypothetical protein
MNDLIAERIRALDDHLRKNPTADVAIMTPGIAALGREAFDRIMKAITAMADICQTTNLTRTSTLARSLLKADLSRSRSTIMSARRSPLN